MYHNKQLDKSQNVWVVTDMGVGKSIFIRLPVAVKKCEGEEDLTHGIPKHAP